MVLIPANLFDLYHLGIFYWPADYEDYTDITIGDVEIPELMSGLNG
jgi:hypothetical protein